MTATSNFRGGMSAQNSSAFLSQNAEFVTLFQLLVEVCVISTFFN